MLGELNLLMLEKERMLKRLKWGLMQNRFERLQRLQWQGGLCESYFERKAWVVLVPRSPWRGEEGELGTAQVLLL